MNKFKPHINVTYPPNNHLTFEEWFSQRYDERLERVYLDVFWTSYFVNNSYPQTAAEVPHLQRFVDELDRSKKYFTIVQYDLGCLVDFKDLDILIFNMSQNNGYPLPLIGQPHPYKFNEPKEYVANFIGTKTHPIREYAESYRLFNGYYVSFDYHNPEKFCSIISKSLFTLCFRGFGANSFRICEALQYGSIPVYISDEFIEPHNIPFEEYGVKIHAEDAHRVPRILENISPLEIIEKQERGKEIYEQYYTYEGCYKMIIRALC